MAVCQDFYFKNVTDLAHTLLFADSAFNHRSTLPHPPAYILLASDPQGKLSLLVWHSSFLMVLCLFLQAHLFYLPSPTTIPALPLFILQFWTPHGCQNPLCYFTPAWNDLPSPPSTCQKLPLPFKTCLDVNCWTLCPFLISNCNHCLFSSISVLASLNILWTPWKSEPTSKIHLWILGV